MGGAGSRRKKAAASYPLSSGTPNTGRPGSAFGAGGGSPNAQRDLMQANQTIQNLNNQLNAMRGGSGVGGQPMPYGGYPSVGPGGQLPMTYGQPTFGQPPLHGAPNPMLQNLPGQNSFQFQQQQQQQQQHQQQLMAGPAVYRDTDFASIANIAGLNPADVAVLHREFMNLTRGGTNKIDRVIFRQILRDALIDASNENVDRTIETLFVNIDRNRDGFIDFPEFVGGFKDVLKADSGDSHAYSGDYSAADAFTEQIRASGVGSGIVSQPMSYIQQPQQNAQLMSTGGLNIVPLASMGIQQSPFVYGATAPSQMANFSPPYLSLDQNQSSYVIATPGQYLITQPTALQCVPLPMM